MNALLYEEASTLCNAKTAQIPLNLSTSILPLSASCVSKLTERGAESRPSYTLLCNAIVKLGLFRLPAHLHTRRFRKCNECGRLITSNNKRFYVFVAHVLKTKILL